MKAAKTYESRQQATGRLIICPTPIGNLGDMPARALDALRDADVVCAEDTRVTGKLLAAFGVEKRLERLDEALIGSRAKGIIDRVLSGEVIAYCSDAGMPGVSDPGLRLVAAARDAGAVVEVLPGPTAAATAYVASGSTKSAFYFGGFFPRKSVEQQAVLSQLKSLDAALVFYESPNRLLAALASIAQGLPLRQVTVCRELTKLHEEIACGTAQELQEFFSRRAEQGALKGEIVLVIDGPNAKESQLEEADALDAARAAASQLLASGMRTKEVAKKLAAEFGIARNDAYAIAMECVKR